MSQGYDPVILIGMHRSGTSLLCRLLEGLGLFVGRDLEHNHESLFFQHINRWSLRQASARWDNPGMVDALLASDKLCDLVTEAIDGRLHGLGARRYLGWRRFLAHRGIDARLAFAWGWKDPRNTYTLPLWLRLFPAARVITIERHGVDVAASLRARAERQSQAAIARYRRFKPLERLRPKRGGFAASVRCLTLAGGLDLWEEYVVRARAHAASLGPGRCLSLHYEDLLRDPVPTLAKAAEFAGLEASGDRLRALTAGIDANRAFAYRADEELATFAARHRDRLAAFDYAEAKASKSPAA